MRCLSRSPSPQPPTPPALTASNQGRGPLPAGFVPARLHKFALMRFGKTCSKVGREKFKGAKTENWGREKRSRSLTLNTHKRLHSSVAFTVFTFYTHLLILNPCLRLFTGHLPQTGSAKLRGLKQWWLGFWQ